MFLNASERTIIQEYLDAGMSPEAIANRIGRLNDDLEPSDLLLIRSIAQDMLDAPPPPPDVPARPVLVLLPGGAARQ